MPYTEDQQTAARIAKHDPGKLFKRNKGLLKMTSGELEKMATAKVKPKAKKKKSGMSAEVAKVFKKRRGY
jgi:hypothetical protein